MRLELQNSSLHSWFRAQLKACVDGELPPHLYTVLRFHLARCAECRSELVQLRRVGSILQVGAREPTAWPGLTERILAQLPEFTPRDGARMRTGPVALWRLSWVAASLVAIMLMTYAMLILQKTNSSQRVPVKAPNAQSSKLPASRHQSYSRRVASLPRTDPFAAQLHNREMHSVWTQKTRARWGEREKTSRKDDSALDSSSSSFERQQTLAFGKGTPDDPLRLSVAVDDLGSSCAHLMGVAQELGGSITLATGPVADAFHLPPSQPTFSEGEQGVCYLLVRMPATQSKRFYRELQRTATLASARQGSGVPHRLLYVQPPTFSGVLRKPHPMVKDGTAEKPTPITPSQSAGVLTKKQTSTYLTSPPTKGSTVVYIVRLHLVQHDISATRLGGR